MYTLPPAPSKKSFIKTSANEIANQIKTLNVPVSDAIMRTVAGLGPVVCREIAFRAFGDNTIYADELTSQQTETLINEIEQVQQHATLGENFYLVKNEKGKPCEFSFTKLTQYLPNYQMVEYQSFSELLCDYYNEKDRAERLWQKSKQLIKSVKNIHERCLRKQIARKEELKETKDREKYKIYGELISANIYKIEKGETKTTVLNYYTNKEIEIKLDPRYSPSKNSQKYYKEYKKKQTAAVMLEKLLLQGEKEIEYLETVIDILQRTETDNVLNEIRAELKGQVYLKYYKQKDKKQKPTDFIKYQSVDGYKIFVGRNNLQNDRLTLKTARGKDLWFHTKNAPGSHVVVFSEGQDIPDTTKNQAAQLAVFHSSQTGGSKVCVDFTQVKNIKKTNDLKPGMVIYDNYETAFITQDDEIIKNITKISF